MQDADRIRRDSVANEVPKTEPEPLEISSTVIADPEVTKIEMAKPVLVSEEADNQNGIEQNVKDDFGIRAEALYDYQAGNVTN